MAENLSEPSLMIKSSKFCELLEFDGFHQIDSNLINFISSNICNIF